jgi:hypothetical protein
MRSDVQSRYNSSNGVVNGFFIESMTQWRQWLGSGIVGMKLECVCVLGCWRRVVWWILTDVSEALTASTIMEIFILVSMRT